MDGQLSETIKKLNANITIILILINLVLALILFTVGSKCNQEVNLFLLSIVMLTLLGGAAFTYNGRAYRTGKWIFF